MFFVGKRMVAFSEKFSALKHSGYRRTQFIRRTLALALLILGIALTINKSATDTSPVIVMTTQVHAGERITAQDIRLASVATATVPHDALTTLAEATDKTAVATAPTGQILTTHSIVSAELATRLIEKTPYTDREDGTLIPVKLADPALAGLLTHGDTVSIISTNKEDNSELVIATHTRVVFAANSTTDQGIEPGTILVALPESAAHKVAAASLTMPIAVVITGARAH